MHEEEFRPAEQALIREREVLAENGNNSRKAAKDRRKSRKSLGRRVSFAPDAQLETMHLYPLEKNADQNTDPNARLTALEKFSNVGYHSKAVQRMYTAPSPSPLQVMRHENEVVAAASPSDMTGGLHVGPAPLSELSPKPAIGEVTAGVPSLADLLQSDGETDLLPEQPVFELHERSEEITLGVPTIAEILQSDGETDQLMLQQHYHPQAEHLTSQGANTDDATADLQEAAEDQHMEEIPEDIVAEIGDEQELLEEGKPAKNEAVDDQDADGLNNETKKREGSEEEAPDSPDLLAESPEQEEAKPRDDSNQINKWGFAPGEDDTQDLNLENKGRMVMGEHTYNHVFGSSDKTMNLTSQQQQQGQDATPSRSLGPSQLDDLFRRADGASDILRSAIKTHLSNSPGSARRQSSLGLGSPLSFMSQPNERSEPGSTPRHSLGAVNTPVDTSKDHWPRSRLSDAFSDRSIMAQRQAVQGAVNSPSLNFSTPQGATPTSRLGTGNTPRSVTRSGFKLAPRSAGAPGDLLSGEPFLAGSPAQSMHGDAIFTPSGPLQAPITVPRTGPGSVEKNLIDLGTPQAEKLAGLQLGKSPLGPMADASSIMPAKKRSRMSVTSTAEDSTDKLIENDGTDELLNGNDDEDQGLGSLPVDHSAQKPGKDMTTRLLLEDTSEGNLSPALQGRQLGWGGALGLRAFAAASSLGVASPNRRQLTPKPGEKTMVTERLIAESTESPLPANLLRAGTDTGAAPDSAKSDVLTEGNEDETMGLNLGATSPEMLAGISMQELDQADAGLRSPEDPQPVVPSPPPMPSMFPGGALLERTPVGKGKRPASTAPTPEPPMTRSKTQALAQGEGEVRSPQTHSPVVQNIPAAVGLARTPPKLSRTPTKLSRTPTRQSPARSIQKQSPAAVPMSTPKPPLHPSALPSASKSGVVTRSAAKAAYTPSPGSAKPQKGLHRLARTPIRPMQPERLTLQDFLREVEIQFLDHMRRGASINLADLASDPPPNTLKECYKLMCLTGPEVAQYDEGIQTLQNEIAARKQVAKEKEAELSRENLPIFEQLQHASAEDHEAIKCGAQALKKLCRLRANLSWKEWRVTVEAQRGNSLQSKLQVLQHDEAFLQSNLKYLKELSNKTKEFAHQARQDAASEIEAHAAEKQRRETVLSLRAALKEQKAANEERAKRRAELEGRNFALQRDLGGLATDKDQLEAALKQRKEELEQTEQAHAALASKELTSEALLSKVYQLDILQGCIGWQLKQGPITPGKAMKLQFGSLFSIALYFDIPAEQPNAATGLHEDTTEMEGCVAMPGPEAWPVGVRKYHTLMCKLLQNPKHAPCLDRFLLPNAKVSALSARLQGYTFVLGRAADLLNQFQGLSLDYPCISQILPGEDGSLTVSFVGLETATKFSVTLSFGRGVAFDAWTATAEVQLPGPNDLTPAAIINTIASVEPCYGRIKAVCTTLSALALGTVPPTTMSKNQDAPQGSASLAPEQAGKTPNSGTTPGTANPEAADGEQDEASLHVFCNPLFNSATPGAAQRNVA